MSKIIINLMLTGMLTMGMTHSALASQADYFLKIGDVKGEAQQGEVKNNRLYLRDKSGKLMPAEAGQYKRKSDGRTIQVKSQGLLLPAVQKLKQNPQKAVAPQLHPQKAIGPIDSRVKQGLQPPANVRGAIAPIDSRATSANVRGAIAPIDSRAAPANVRGAIAPIDSRAAPANVRGAIAPID